MSLLEVQDLRTEFRRTDGERLTVVDGISFAVEPGKALAIVGESGSGKSVTVRSLLGLLPRTAKAVGSAQFQGKDLLKLKQRDLRKIRGRDIGMVFQNAMEAMNPTMTVERQLTEHLLWHGICGKAEARDRAVRALGDVGIPEPERRIRMYPFQLSGGMRQRAMIAMAMITRPALLIADEPTTAVDVTIQRQLLDLLAGLKEQGTGIIMITHDLGVARYFCEDVMVMYAGRVMERSATLELLDRPRHPYSVGLIGSSIEVGGRELPLIPIPGSPPDLARRPAGCPFHPRCTQAEQPRCSEPQEMIEIEASRPEPVEGPTSAVGHGAACWKAAALV